MTCLIVANQTLGGPRLQWEIQSRIDAGTTDFHVLVPIIKPGLEAANQVVWHPGASSEQPSRTEARHEAKHRAEHRLAKMIDLVNDLGGTAKGEVGTTNAVNSIRWCLRHGDYDEILISTLPSGFSHWLKADLPARVAQVTDIPVVTVTAEQ